MTKKVPFVPSFDPTQVTKEHVKSGGQPFIASRGKKQVEIQATDYTFLNPENIYQTPELIALMHEATGKPPIDLVSFKPERILFQVIAASISAYIQYPNEEERNRIILDQFKEMKNLSKQFDTTYDDIKKQIDQALREGTDNKILSEIISEAKNQVSKLKEAEKFPSDYCQISENALIMEIAASAYYKQKIYPEMRKMVKEKIEASSLPKKNKNTERAVLLLAGGSASGKGTSHAILLAEASRANINTLDLVLINSDSYKALLVKPTTENAAIFSQISYPEARLIIRAMAHEMADQENAHLLIDQVKPIKKDFDYAAPDSCTILGIYVSTKAEDALKRAFSRGSETLRFEDTQGLLRGHKEVVEQLLTRIKEQSTKPTPIRLRFVDNNVAKGELPIPFMEINFQDRHVSVYNQDMLSEFLKKQFINEKATRYGEIYHPPEGKELDLQVEAAKERFIAELKSFGFEVETKPKLGL